MMKLNNKEIDIVIKEREKWVFERILNLEMAPV